MRITDILRRENCAGLLSSHGKQGVIKELCGLLESSGHTDGGTAALESVIGRENLGSTGVGDGVAIPHAKTSGVKSVVCAFGLSPEGVDFYAADGKPVKIFFLLLAPEEAVGDHLKALARIARLVRRESFRNRMERNMGDAGAIYDIISEEDAALG
ncbi:MAG: PTS sugar transporter subunit IIA [Nitrospinae bacterium]|nr:PTS sugar transporter subunit IIA [Nitrospinota bacterium]